MRKYNKDFEEEIAKFRENPDQADEDEDEDKGTWDLNVISLQYILQSLCASAPPVILLPTNLYVTVVDKDDDSSDDDDSHPAITKKPSVEPTPEPKVSTKFFKSAM